jgi:hypothetical protein
LFILIACNLNAQSSGDYRSISSGDWDNINIWQVFDGVAWVSTATPPSNASGVITIFDSVVVSGTDSADQLVINTGAILNIQGSLKLLNGTGTDMQCAGKLIISSGGALNNDADISDVEYTGSVLQIDGGFSPFITFDGTSAQTINGISGSGYFGRRITLNNINGLYITGTGANFAGVNFITGKIFATGIFLIGQYSAGEFSGQSQSNFIDGNVVCTLFDNSLVTFSLPVGKGNDYLPLDFTIQLASSVESSFEISIHDGPPPVHTLTATLDKISNGPYYTLANVTGTGIQTASLKLSYNADDGVTDPANLRIAESSGSDWVDLGGSGTSAGSGTITSNAFTTVGDFALANATGGSNTLPVNLVSFSASTGKQSVLLNWQTANEINNNYFVVERATNIRNMSWQELTQINSKGNAAQLQSYFYEDRFPLNGENLYRLKQVDKDGRFSYSQIVSAHVENGITITVFPNPVKDILNIYGLNAGSNGHIFIIDKSGKIVAAADTKNASYTWQVQNLAAGLYYLKIESAGKTTVMQFMKQ